MSEKVAIYARVSTDRQEKEETIETQLMVVRDYCKAHDYDATEYLDEGYSGITLDLEDRPAGARLLEVSQNGRDFDKVIIYARDRLGRGLPAKLAQRKFDKLGIEVISVTEPHTQEFVGRVTSDFTSEIYAETVRKNTINGRLRSAKDGKWPQSTVPYGYKRVDGYLEEDPATAAVVRRMYELGDNGAGISAIATRLNEDGVATASTQGVHGWQPAVVWKLLTNKRYIGKAMYGGIEIDIPALVSEEQFVRIGKAMTKRAEDAPRRTKRTYLLQKLLRCRTCGGRLMSRVWSRDQRRYMCYTRTRYGGHEGVVSHIFADDAEARIIKLVEDFMADPEHAANDMDVYADHIDNLNEKAATELPELDRRLADLIAQEDVIVDLAASKQITEEQLARKMGKVDADRVKIKGQIDGLKSETDFDAAQVRSSWARMIAKRLRKGQVKVAPRGKIIASMDPRLVKAYIRSFIDLIWLEPDGKLTVEGPVNVSGSPSS